MSHCPFRPNIVKAGLVFSGSYGEGELIEDSKVIDYYNTVTSSWRRDNGSHDEESNRTKAIRWLLLVTTITLQENPHASN